MEGSVAPRNNFAVATRSGISGKIDIANSAYSLGTDII